VGENSFILALAYPCFSGGWGAQQSGQPGVATAFLSIILDTAMRRHRRE